MKVFVASLASVGPYFQSRNYLMEIPKLAKESNDDFEKRTWRNRTHTNDDGQIIITAQALQHSIQAGAKYLNERIPERGMETWTKHFAAGILIPEAVVLPERRETVEGLWLSMNPQGRKEGGTRVMRCMPFIPRWAADVTIYVLDDLIVRDILARVIEHAGSFIGIGQNRPQKGGIRGRYQLVELVEVHEPSLVRKAA